MYKSIFEEVISIMHHDYSGFEDKRGWDHPDDFREILNANMNTFTDDDFTAFVADYLVDFKDDHIFFKRIQKESEPQQVRGFQVRRFEDGLYVIAVQFDEGIHIGEKIIALDGIPIEELRKRHHRYVNENHPEREKWNPILAKHATCTIQNEQGTKRIVEMRFFDKVARVPIYSIEKMVEGPVLITFTDFADPDTISTLIRNHLDLIAAAESLIVDVRINFGGSDVSYYELLPYLFPKEEQELFDPALHTMLYNCTKRTCDLQLKGLDEQLAQIKDEQTRSMLNNFKKFFEKNAGKGFVNFSDGENNSFIMKGKEMPKKVIVLSDVYCGSSGDSFVENTKLSDKVTVVGRATAGLNDYINLTCMRWKEGFEFWYPTSKLKRVDDGKGMTGIGIEPDLYIPWTPEHIHKDVDMQKALELLR